MCYNSIISILWPQVVYLVNSGSEANDLAMLLARIHTKNNDIISLRNAYHGMSPYVMGITAHSTWKFEIPANQGIHHVSIRQFGMLYLYQTCSYNP